MLRGTLVAGIACVWLTAVAFALNPARDIGQYVHDKWGAGQGFVGGTVFAICQSQDGYLWIGTERGLVRFDGFNFTLIQKAIPDMPPLGPVRGLATDAEGNMWIRLDGSYLLLYRNGKFENAMVRFGLHEISFTAMSVDGQGELFLWGPQNRLLRFHHGKFIQYPISPDIPGIVISISETSEHKIWMGTRDVGLFQINEGHAEITVGGMGNSSSNTLLPASGDGMWVGTDTGLRSLTRLGVVTTASFGATSHLQILALTRDRDGNAWVGTIHGIVRISPAAVVSTELLKPRIGLEHNPDDEVTAIYEDHDGDIWFGGPHGIERLREGMFTAFSAVQGLPSRNGGPLYTDVDGRTWFAPSSGGLYWLKDRRSGYLTIAGLDKDVIYSIDGGNGEIWVGRQHGGLTVLRGNGSDSFTARTYTETDGLAQNSVYSVHRNRDGSVWAGTVSAGVSCLRNGAFTNYSAANGLESGAIFSIVEGYDGTMWFATPSGLEEFAKGYWKNYAVADGLPSSNVRSIFEDSKHILWIATSDGLAYLASGHISAPKYLADSLREVILGVTEDKQSALWIVTSDHVLRVVRDRLLDGRLNDADVQSYGTEDGLPWVEGVSRERSVVTDANGCIWISLARGLATADPAATARNARPVSVRIETIAAGGNIVDPAASPVLPSGTNSVILNYADSNLSVPQRVRFRYRLDGSDQGWSDEVPLHQVVFTNLSPGPYRFHIMASNGSGLWNGSETTVQFSVSPAFWQTWWFRTVSVAILCLVLIAIYRLRMSRLTQQLDLRFNERLAERIRIAQELHDTLLQSVLSATFQLDVIENQTPHNSPMKPHLRRILELMARVNEEGRDALRGLRTADSLDFSLETSLSSVEQEIANENKVNYRVTSQVASRNLTPMIRDEVYRIGREAVANAFLHSQATNIEVEVEYGKRFLRVHVRDDGSGMDARMLVAGREGHWGLVGMRERAESIGASLKLRSRIGAGTEVELTVPAAIAYESNSSKSIFRRLGWYFRTQSTPTSATNKSEATHDNSSPNSHS